MIKLLFEHDLLVVITIGFTFAVGLLLLIKGYRFSSPKLYAGLFVFGYGCYLLMYILTTSGMISKFPTMLKWPTPFHFVIPPALYLFFRNETENFGSQVKKRDLIHFILFFLAVIDMIPYFLLEDEQRKEIIFSIQNDINNIFKFEGGIVPTIFHFYARAVQESFYLVLILNIWWKHRKNLFRSNRWFVFCGLFMLLGRTLVLLIGVSAVRSGVSDVCEINFFFLPYFILGATWMVCWQLLKFYFQFDNDQLIIEDLAEESEQNECSEIELDEISLAIVNYQRRFPEWMIGDLKMSTFSRNVGIPRYKLTAYLNRKEKCNFNEWVNGHRILQFLARVEAGELKKYTILSLAEQCGFNSRTTFYNAFKRKLGKSPRTYFSDKMNISL